MKIISSKTKKPVWAVTAEEYEKYGTIIINKENKQNELEKIENKIKNLK